GAHSITVRLADATAITRAITAEVGAREELAFLPPPSAAPAPQPEEAPVLSEAPRLSAPESPPSAAPRVFTWVAAGLTGVFGAGIAGFGLSAQAKHSQWVRQAGQGLMPDQKLKSSGQTFE